MLIALLYKKTEITPLNTCNIPINSARFYCVVQYYMGFEQLSYVCFFKPITPVSYFHDVMCVHKRYKFSEQVLVNNSCVFEDCETVESKTYWSISNFLLGILFRNHLPYCIWRATGKNENNKKKKIWYIYHLVMCFENKLDFFY
jgi:hypothetical protein